jgi:abortive infection bacteriophage resistance protein
MKFEKPAKTIPEQVQLLVDRGLDVPDHSKASHYLSHLNYYRLSGYWIPFEASRAPHKFKPGASFDDVLNLYVFDRELRLLILDAIERIEVSIRTQWAYHFSHHAGAHGYLDRKFTSSAKKHSKFLASIARSVADSKEQYIAHYRTTYTAQPDMPPIWSVCEILSFGDLSRWYEMLRPIALRKKIANTYDLPEQFLESTLHALSYLRNLCAHHSRAWNRELTVLTSLPKTRPKALAEAIDKDASNRKIYNAMCVIKHFLDVISPSHQWDVRLQNLITKHAIDVQQMGFPEDWNDRTFWSRTTI